MAIHNMDARAKKTSLSAVITRANGRVENLGIIAFRHKNPLIHYPVNWWIKVKEMMRKDK